MDGCSSCGTMVADQAKLILSKRKDGMASGKVRDPSPVWLGQRQSTAKRSCPMMEQPSYVSRGASATDDSGAVLDGEEEVSDGEEQLMGLRR